MPHLAAVPFQHAGADKRIGTVAMRRAMAFLPIGDVISNSRPAFATPCEVTVWRTLAQTLFFVPVALMLRWKFSRRCRPG